ncbi:MAG: hypothetical protein M0P69_15230, partial [Bacteroidales bacterium]|nr:hypothetical protein [Bacteroidales bacterium]
GHRMKLLWKYLKPQRWLILAILLLAGISQLLSLVDPLIFGKIRFNEQTSSEIRYNELRRQIRCNGCRDHQYDQEVLRQPGSYHHPHRSPIINNHACRCYLCPGER